jgi:N-acetyl-gamma-glutamyl-phosphate reductase
MARPRIFIDGEHGTTGLQIRARLAGRDDLDIVSIDADKRKDEAERRRLLNAVDVAVLCLPDEAAREAVALIERPGVRILDGSSAHRVTPGWVYGFPELAPGQAAAIAGAARVSVPGCYATATVGLLRPLVDAGLIPASHPIAVQGVQGYSGGGRQLVDAMEGRGGEHRLTGPYRAYALELVHKHQPEMRVYGGLDAAPLFTPAVGAWRQGQLVQIPLNSASLPGRPSAESFHAAYQRHYAGQRFVSVMPFEAGGAPSVAVIGPEALAGTNRMEIYVFENEALGHILLMARMDNLGKGASGAAVQNLDLMLGLEAGRDYAVPT